MNKTILAVAAILLASGTAFASERQGDAAPAVVVNQDAVAASTAASVPLPRQGDAVPASVVVNAPQAPRTTAPAHRSAPMLAVMSATAPACSTAATECWSAIDLVAKGGGLRPGRPCHFGGQMRSMKAIAPCGACTLPDVMK